MNLSTEQFQVFPPNFDKFTSISILLDSLNSYIFLDMDAFNIENHIPATKSGHEKGCFFCRCNY